MSNSPTNNDDWLDELLDKVWCAGWNKAKTPGADTTTVEEAKAIITAKLAQAKLEASRDALAVLRQRLLDSGEPNEFKAISQYEAEIDAELNKEEV